MTRCLFRTIYGAEYCQLQFNYSCSKEHPFFVCVPWLAHLAKCTSLASLLIRQGSRPFSQALQTTTVALVLAPSHSICWRKFTSSNTLPIHAHHCHQHTAHFSLRQTVNSWDHQHQCLQQQWRSYAKKGWDNQ